MHKIEIVAAWHTQGLRTVVGDAIANFKAVLSILDKFSVNVKFQKQFC